MNQLRLTGQPLSRRAQQSISGGATSSIPSCFLQSSSGQSVVHNCYCSNYPVAIGTTCNNSYIVIEIIAQG